MGENSQPLNKGLWSNLVIAITAVGLGLVIVLDGKLFNTPTTATAVYPLKSPRWIKLSHNNTPLLAFNRHHNNWLITEPHPAPAMAARIAVLLDSNKHISRSYAVAEVPYAELFENAVSLQIDSHLFRLGAVEPVSKLRYVSANDRVYLQPDVVIPLLQSGYHSFTDLQVTAEVTRVAVDNQAVIPLDPWENLHSIAIVARPDTSTGALASITVTDNADSERQFKLYLHKQGVTLAEQHQEYGYLLSMQQTDALHLSHLLPTIDQ